jgi:hypothetical protein
MNSWWTPKLFLTDGRHETGRFFPWPSPATADGESQNAFCVPDTSLPVGLRAEFPFSGRIDGQNKKTLCFTLKQSLLKTS